MADLDYDLSLLQLEKLGIDLEDATTEAYVRAGIEWIEENTTYRFGKQDAPFNIKVFLAKYCEVLEQTTGVTSEGIAGMTQAFSSDGIQSQLYQWADTLLAAFGFRSARAVPSANRWR